MSGISHLATGRTRRAVVRDILDDFGRHNLLTYASAISYQVLSSLIPFVSFVLGLMGVLSLRSLWFDDLAPTVSDAVSGDVFAVIDHAVVQILDHQQVFWVTAGLALALWQVSGAVRAVMEALDKVYEVDEQRGKAERYAVSVALALALAVIFLVALGAILLGPLLLGHGPLSVVVRYGAAGLLLTLSVALTLRVAPKVRPPVSWVGAGSLLIVLGWLASIGGYVLYASRVASYQSIFGSLAAVFVLLVVVYIAAVVFLGGIIVDLSVREQTTAWQGDG